MKRFWKILTVVLVVAGIAAYFVVKNRKPAAADVRKVQVVKDSIAVNIQATGQVQPQDRVEIKPPIAGRIEDVLVHEGDGVRKGQILAYLSSSERAALIDAARAKGPEELKHWEDLYRPAPLVAPLTGVIIARNVEPGQTLTSADAVLVMSNRLIVIAQVDETDIRQIKIGQEATISLDAYPNETIAAKVDHIAFEAKTVSNVTIYEVDVAPNKVPDFMRSGMTANVLFSIGKKDDALVVPSEAIQFGDDGSYVRVPGDKHPEKRAVTTGLSNGKETEIVSGLNEGDTVLIRTVKFDQKSAAGSNPFSPFGARRPGGAGGAGGSGGGARQRQ
jgi:macrolide-specific efflux system membrane fusion protein